MGIRILVREDGVSSSNLLKVHNWVNKFDYSCLRSISLNFLHLNWKFTLRFHKGSLNFVLFLSRNPLNWRLTFMHSWQSISFFVERNYFFVRRGILEGCLGAKTHHLNQL